MQLLVISSKVTANDLGAPTACLEAINRLKWPPQCLHSVSVKEVLKQQYTSCVKVVTGGNLDLSREYHKKQFGPLFYSWWNCPLRIKSHLGHVHLAYKANLNCKTNGI